MTPTEARTAWSSALRSGQYKQTKSQLCNIETNAYCCLGVACEVYQQHVGDLKVVDLKWGSHSSPRDYDGSTSCLPLKVARWLNMDIGGGFSANGIDTCLIALNDNQNATFEEIADVIDNPEIRFRPCDNSQF